MGDGLPAIDFVFSCLLHPKTPGDIRKNAFKQFLLVLTAFNHDEFIKLPLTLPLLIDYYALARTEKEKNSFLAGINENIPYIYNQGTSTTDQEAIQQVDDLFLTMQTLWNDQYSGFQHFLYQMFLPIVYHSFIPKLNPSGFALEGALYREFHFFFTRFIAKISSSGQSLNFLFPFPESRVLILNICLITIENYHSSSALCVINFLTNLVAKAINSDANASNSDSKTK